MEPLSALSLAGNVIQFIEFTTKLLSTSIEVYRSAEGASNDHLTLGEICGQLSGLSGRLRASKVNHRESASELALRDIADLCNADCARILAVLNDLKVKEGSHRAWNSFRHALKHAWKGEREVEKLMGQLRDRQAAMTLHICALSNEWLIHVNQQLQALGERDGLLQAQHQDRLGDISLLLKDIKLQLNNSKVSKHGHTLSATVLDNLVDKISRVSIAERNIAKEQSILKSLNYDSRGERYESVDDAHEHTFKWILEASDQDGGNDSKFLKWLRESSGVFWISGKPGSGKSTLMKFLVDHRKTRDALEVWAAPRKVAIASHFFWYSGDSIQKSTQGLFRSLLFDIFRKCPELIVDVCPTRWAATDLSYTTWEDWSLKELVQCLRRIGGNDTAFRFCFFIDGLDEFEGDYIEISQILTEIAKSPHIKVCVASRPLNEFQDQFGVDKSAVLLIHQLTRDDILSYARSRLENHPRWPVLRLDTGATQSFLEKIVRMACGVFLWVTLVTRSLRNGLTNDDTMEDLNARLDSLPITLEAFYRRMLDSVDPIYHHKSASLLRMAMVRDQPFEEFYWELPWMIALLHEREHTNPDYAISMPRTALSPDDIKCYRQQASRRLNAKCRGLLEIRRDKLMFIHRTASDYLRTLEMVDYIRARSSEGLNPYLSILRAYVACLKIGLEGTAQVEGTAQITAPIRGLSQLNFISPDILNLIQFAERVRNEGIEDTVVFELIACAEDFLMSMDQPEEESHSLNSVKIWSTPQGLFPGPQFSSRLKCFLISAGSTDYAVMKLSSDADYFRTNPTPVLWQLLCGFDRNNEWHPSAIKLLRLLLHNNYDPNELFLVDLRSYALSWASRRVDDWASNLDTISLHPLEEPELKSIWFEFLVVCGVSGYLGRRRQVESVLYRCCRTSRSRCAGWMTYLNSSLAHGVYSLLLQYGADPNAHPTPFTTVWVDFVCFAIKYPSKITAVDHYIQSLDSFFKYGAKLGTPVIGLTLLPGDATSHLPFRMVPGWDIFCEALEECTGFQTEQELKFIAQITMRMAEQAINVRWPLGRLASIISRVFPEPLRRPLLDTISASRGDGNDTRGKRPRGEITGIEENNKRLKP
ncbi:hypothetical protein F5Y04DRAFT_160000 [Hypomontagnella monticulosa]|nr:hypothetical protein F5Y04DRAFT_160000 [Hypomontagnella monticulosa]